MSDPFVDAYDPKHPNQAQPFVVLANGSIVVVSKGDPLLQSHALQQVIRTSLGDIRVVLP